MRSLNFKLLLTLFAVAVMASCGSDDPDPINEEELITTVTISFTNTGDTDEVVTATFRDLDGPGGEDPVIGDLVLNANATYDVRLEFLNEQETPTEDITEEVLEEDLEHQVFYQLAGSLNLTLSYDDQDSQGNPIGVEAKAVTGAASVGTLRVILIHEPNKSATGVAQGDPGNAGGEEDISVQFNVTLQ